MGYDMSSSNVYWSWKLYYYSYLIITFFVLLNILLAIIVDAYVEVKDDANNSKGVGSDIYKIVSNTHVGCCCKKHPDDEELFQTLDPTRKKTKKKSGKKDNGNMTAVAPDGSIKISPKKRRTRMRYINLVLWFNRK